MGKGSGACGRPGITLGTSDSASPELNLGGDAASVSEINTTLEIQRFGKQWWTKDEAVTYQKTKEGWVVHSFSNSIRKAFKEYGIIYQQAGTSSYELTYFPSLKAARLSVNDVSLEAGLNIDCRLTRGKYVAYNIGDLPLIIRREESYWRVYSISSALSPSLKDHFNTTQEFLASWESINIGSTRYPTRKAAHQAVLNWVTQTISKN